MKTSINKSELFKRAWELFKKDGSGKDRYEYVGSRRLFCKGNPFGYYLRQAWREEKQIQRYLLIKPSEEEASRRIKEDVESHDRTMSCEWYTNRPAFSRNYHYVGD